MNRQHSRSNKAFTIVELLVVVGILALLLGMLLPALAGAQKRSKKHKELNAIRQVGLGWTLYANANNDKLLPGYLDDQVQQRWRVKYEYPNHWDIPVGELAGPWTWRLLPYLDNDILTVHAYADEPGYEDVELDPNSTGATPGGMASTARPIAYEPGFGYNAYYVGGWWTMDSGVARPLFYDAQSDEGGSINLLSRSVGTIRRPTELVAFCSSSLLEPGVYRKFSNSQLGSHLVVPSWLGGEEQWEWVGALQTHTRSSAPIGRYNGLAATLYTDGHTGTNKPDDLADMRKWIDAARTSNFRHQ
jgi:hypothetical protein